MTTVTFYEKPGCGNNTRQKRLLEASGHEVIACNLLVEPWSADRLRSFFGTSPVAEWFNRAAPRVKQGEIDPASMDEAGALALMLADPLLIRRPLMEAEGVRSAGFDPEKVAAWIGLSAATDRRQDVERCQRGDAAPCPAPEEKSAVQP